MIKLVNAHDMMIVNYGLLQVKGFLDPFCGCEQLVVCLESTDVHGMRWAMCYGKFKIFVPLNLGMNFIALKCIHFEAKFRVIYKISTSTKPHHVVPVYVICADGSEHFQAPVELTDSGIHAARKRIIFGMRLLQSLTAENLLAELGERSTFLLHRDIDQLADECLVHHSRMSSAEVYKMDPKTVWKKLAQEFYAAYPDGFDRKKWVAFMACTRYFIPESTIPNSIQTHEQLLKATKGYFALGRGGLALLGTGTLHAWPEDLHGLQAALLDDRTLDKSGMMDDTAYRHTFWAAYATGLGSVWHEMGHCFGLDHSLDGIMNRGGDDINLCISFPPRGISCLHGCMSSGSISHPRPFEHIPPQFRLTPALATGIQFWKYACLTQINWNSTLNRVSSPFSYCSSLWHQGSAYWGFDQAQKLIRNSWIVRCS